MQRMISRNSGVYSEIKKQKQYDGRISVSVSQVSFLAFTV
jgi:hypothetical protein